MTRSNKGTAYTDFTIFYDCTSKSKVTLVTRAKKVAAFTGFTVFTAYTSQNEKTLVRGLIILLQSLVSLFSLLTPVKIKGH